ncbi:hypothetical protein GGX14DRAFT_439374 [Mycena pura]|uniref:Ribonuclease H1 N-terminal domain-containing protein n=1 Tax=Mycena pura TaxID=153505 RepID=A0AAD6YF60_9AGAR|nr:hypothetical protein GGX14DRAFT_439374 [Mycena pura]
MAKKKWYVVTVGRQVGVFNTWIEVSPLVTGVSGALHQSFSSEEDANELFAQEQSNGRVRIVGRNSTAATTGPALTSLGSSSRLHTEVPITSGQTQVQSCSSQEPPLRPDPSHSGQSSTLNRPTTVKREWSTATSPSRYPLSSPPTGITQFVDLSSSSSAVAPGSPSAFRGTEDQPDRSLAAPAQHTTSTLASSSYPGPHYHSVARSLSGSAHLGSESSLFPPMIINITVPMQHMHCSACELGLTVSSQMTALDVSEDNSVPCAVYPGSPLTQPGLTPVSLNQHTIHDTSEHDITSLSSRMDALDVSENNSVAPSRTADPRSPLTQRGLLPGSFNVTSSGRPSPTIVPSALFDA